MQQSASIRFATTARTLGQAARSRNLTVPGFRSPPRLPHADRTLRRRLDGSATVSVALHDRPFVAVIADMVEGIVVTNRLEGIDATRARTALWEAVSERAEAA